MSNESLSGFDETVQVKGGLLEFILPGQLIHFNTIEEYQAFKWENIKIETAGNQFALVMFGDLKNYDFHYKFACLKGPEKFTSLKGKKLSKAVDEQTISSISQAIVENVEQNDDRFIS